MEGSHLVQSFKGSGTFCMIHISLEIWNSHSCELFGGQDVLEVPVFIL